MGLDKIFIDANFEWREAGCSMCLGMNPDIYLLEKDVQVLLIETLKDDKVLVDELIWLVLYGQLAAAINGHFVDVRKMD